MTIRSGLITTAAVALVALTGSSAFALEREQNVYFDMQQAQQAPTTLWDVMQGHQPAPREEVRNTVDPQIRTDAASGSSIAPEATPAPDPHAYDYLSGPTYRGGD